MSLGPTGPRVALASTAAHAHLDEDLAPLGAALARQGIGSVVADWHDEGVDWAAFDLVVIRSAWDYTDHLDDFLRWVARVAGCTRLANPVEVIRWSADKRYLVALAGAGVPVVDTVVLEPGSTAEVGLPGTVVVKPVVSAGGRDTERYPSDRRTEAVEHAARLLAAGRAVLVQPYLDGVDDHGETGMVYLGDRLSHGFRKGPILSGTGGFVEGLYREEDISAREPSDTERAVAEAALDSLADLVPGWSRRDLLYARVDVVPGPAGPQVLELELVEPSLFLDVAPGAADRAARAIAATLTRSP